MKEIGVLSGYDMTIEGTVDYKQELTSTAALTKLQFLFGKGLSCEEVKKCMKKNLAGELTPPKKMSDLMPPIPSLEKSRTTKEIIWPFQVNLDEISILMNAVPLFSWVFQACVWL